MDVRHIVTATELGPVTISADDAQITGVYFPAEVYQPRRPRPITPEVIGRQVAARQDELLDAAVEELANYLAGRRMAFQLPLTIPDIDGEPIQLSVWGLVTQIQSTRTSRYAQAGSHRC